MQPGAVPYQFFISWVLVRAVCLLALAGVAGCGALESMVGSPGVSDEHGVPVSPDQGLTPLRPSSGLVAKEIKIMWQALEVQSDGLVADRKLVAEHIRNDGLDGETYRGTVAAIHERLQRGTTPANPVLIKQWNEAQGALDKVAWTLAALDVIYLERAEAQKAAGGLAKTIAALLGRDGAQAVDRENLSHLATDAARIESGYGQLRAQADGEITSQARFVTTERETLEQLKQAVTRGTAIADMERPSFSSGAEPAAQRTMGREERTGPPPLVLIRFDRPNVSYQEDLARVVARALALDPNTGFRVLAIAPNLAGAGPASRARAEARQYAEAVVRSLVGLGINQEKIGVGEEARREALNSEVHIFLEQQFH